MEEGTIYIDGSYHILGRLSSWIAQRVLAGDEVVVVNAQNVVVSGRKRFLVDSTNEKRQRAVHTNPKRGPFYPRMPDRILRRTVRGMLPWKKTSGKDAFRRLSAFIEIPDEFADKEFTTVPEAMRIPSHDYITVGELARAVGWQHDIKN